MWYNKDKLKWFTISEYVDIETGELITKSEKERKYIVIKKEVKNEINEERKQGIRRIVTICRRNGQQEFSFD